MELQNKAQLFIKDRFIFYMSGAISKQGIKGKNWDFSLYPVYGIFLLNFTLPEGKACLRTDVAYMDMVSKELFSDRSRMIFLQLPYFTKSEEECITNMDKWFYILTRMDTLERMPWKAQKAAFEKLMERAETANFTPEEQAQYEAQLDAYRAMNSAMAQSKLEGTIEGKKEMAQRLKELGIDLSVISQSSGLTIDEIKKL